MDCKKTTTETRSSESYRFTLRIKESAYPLKSFSFKPGSLSEIQSMKTNFDRSNRYKQKIHNRKFQEV